MEAEESGHRVENPHESDDNSQHEEFSARRDISEEFHIDNQQFDQLPAQLPTAVVEVKHTEVNADDNRSVSSQRSESGYHSSGALSDGPPAAALHRATSSLRSVGSVGSHGSIGRDGYGGGLLSIFNSETRYTIPVSAYSYPASEAAKSDIATVCSGSVIEDIEVSSIDMNIPQTSSNVFPSTSHSDRFVVVAGGNLRRSVEFAPSAFTQHKYAVLHPMDHLQAPALQTDSRDTSITLGVNDMGPPLSRALLMQGGLHFSGSVGGSRPSSVRSFGSNAGASQNSDVVAHVDTDDCGGSLVESIPDGHSVHSQEDVKSIPEGEASSASKEEDGEKMELSADEETHPLLKSSSSLFHPNGRTSPGGTIYKGKGVRRYQGRYMNLPLKRFNPEAASEIVGTVLEADKVMREECNRRGRTRSRSHSPHRIYKNSPERRYRTRRRSPTPAHRNGYNNASNLNDNHQNGDRYRNGYNRRYRSRSRSNSRSRSRSPARSSRNRRRRNHDDYKKSSIDSPLRSPRRCRNNNGARSNANKTPPQIPSSRPSPRRERRHEWNS